MFGFPWRALATELGLVTLLLLMLVVDLFLPHRRKKWLGALGLLGLGVCLHLALRFPPSVENLTLLAHTYTADTFLFFFRLFALLVGFLILLSALDYSERLKAHRGEFYTLIVVAVLGIILVAGSTDLILVFLFIELVSLTFYVLVGYLKGQPYSNEAAIKYILYGASCSAVMLYGMSLLYGLTGSTNLYAIGRSLGREHTPLHLLALFFLLTGLGFKVSMVPFHQWTPDVYQGAPTPITAFLSTGPKAAGFAVLFRFLAASLEPLHAEWSPLVALLATATMVVGNVTALVQTSMKRMLAYSTIAHAGYMLAGVAASQGRDYDAIFAVQMYLLVYLFANVGAFAVVMWFERTTGTDSIEEFTGLGQQAPFYAAALTLFLLSLTGIPPTAGFWGKYFIFLATLKSPHWWLALAIVVNTLISVGYYLNVVRVMYLQPSSHREPFLPSPSITWTLTLSLLATLLLGLLPNQALLWLQATSTLVFMVP